MSSLDEDDDELDNSEDDDDACLENDFYSKQDARHRKVVKEACTIMGSVNKSTMTMGMEAPFCPADEVRYCVHALFDSSTFILTNTLRFYSPSLLKTH